MPVNKLIQLVLENIERLTILKIYILELYRSALRLNILNKSDQLMLESAYVQRKTKMILHFILSK